MIFVPGVQIARRERSVTVNETYPDHIRFTDARGNVSVFRPDDIRGLMISPGDHYVSARASPDVTIRHELMRCNAFPLLMHFHFHHP
jgi:hypothetical protein